MSKWYKESLIDRQGNDYRSEFDVPEDYDKEVPNYAEINSVEDDEEQE